MKNKKPLVLLAGRTNVGKSALYNRIVGHKTSLVLDRDGVTRDWIEDEVRWGKKLFRLADIGGLEKGGIIEDLIKDAFEQKVQEAKVVVMVCDVITGPTNKDLEVAKLLKTYKKQVILAVNKADDESKDLSAYEFMQLGLGEPIAMSALHARGVGDLLEKICDFLPNNVEEIFDTPEKPLCRICILGKPNAGKSSLLNRILGEQRAIVSEIPGTTREAIIDRFYINNEPFQLADTAGVRRQRSVDDVLETMMVKSSMEAVRTSDFVVLVIDGSNGQICAQDLKLLNYATEQKKAIVLAINKLDIMNDEYLKQTLASDLDEYNFLAKKFPVIKISCKENKNIEKLKQTIITVWRRCNQVFDSDQVDEIIKEALNARPIYKDGHVIKVWRTRTIPGSIPTFHFKFNMPQFVADSHLNYIENILRAKLDLFGCPIRISYS